MIAVKKLFIAFIIATISLLFVSFVVSQEAGQPQLKEIGKSIYYNTRSSLFVWLNNIPESAKPTFTENVQLYEDERKKYSDYYRERNDRVKASENSSLEPPFNREICVITMSGGYARHTFCSCGDAVCASYEDKATCPIDCGICPEGTVHKRGQCVEYLPNTCMNTVCEKGENETCPWDCRIYMIEEKAEIIGRNESNLIRERAKQRAKEFVESRNGVFVYGNENETVKETLAEEVE